MDRMQEAEQEFEHEFEQELEAESELESENEQELEGEFENEYESELETESESESGEQFLGSIVSGLGSLLGGSGETEAELEQEFEGEFEQEQELEQGEQFFGKLIRRAAPFLKRIAKVAAPLVSKAVAAAIPGPFGALAGSGIQGLAGLLREQEHESLESEFEHEHEHEQEHELGEQEISQSLGEHELMAEAMAHFAAQAEQELEAEAMVGAATTLTLSPNDRRTLRRMIPHLVRGAAVLTRVLRARRITRPWVRVVPSIVRRTAQSLRRSAASGQPITRARAATAMARQTRRVLSSPRYCSAVLRRNVRAARATTRPLGVARRTRSLQ